MRVFISSRMSELAAERQVVEDALEGMGIEAWVFERDAGARPDSIQDVYRAELARADLYLGLFWKTRGVYTVDEFEHAQLLGKPCLIYEKRLGLTDGSVQRAPDLEAFLDAIGSVEKGVTPMWFETPDDLARRVRTDVVRWILKEGERLRVAEPPPAGTERRRLQVLLDDVRRTWIEDKLEPLRRDAPLLRLAKKTQTDAVIHPAGRTLVHPAAGQTIPAAKSIYEVFDEEGPGLLVLGGPGSGKTTTLLELADQLLQRAATLDDAPVPVVLKLGSWKDGQPFEAWVEEEVNVLSVRTKPEWVRPWLDEHRLLLLLDGLDEVAPERRAACVTAINAFTERVGVSGLVVTSRLQEYVALDERLRLRRAVVLEPLAPEQIRTYLNEGGTDLAALQQAMAADPVLQELAQTPLMLHVMHVAYRGKPAVALNQPGLDTIEARRRHTFEAFLDEQFAESTATGQSYGRTRVERGLQWLARQMQSNHQPVFFIEELQPNWLTPGVARWSYALASRLTGGLLLGLLLGTALGVAIQVFGIGLQLGLFIGLMAGGVTGCITGWRFAVADGPPGVSAIVAPLLVIGLLAAAVSMLVTTWHDALFVGLVGVGVGTAFGIRMRDRTLDRDVRTFEPLRWSPAGARRGAFLGAGVGGLAGAGMGLAAGGGVWSTMLLIAAVAALTGALIGAAFGALQETSEMPEERVELPRRRMALHNMAMGALAGALTGGAVLGSLSLLMGNGFQTVALNALAGLVFFGVLAALWYGGFDLVQHYVLRIVLVLGGKTPRRYARFLDYAARLVLLRKVGSGYEFTHRLLQEHIAGRDTNTSSRESSRSDDEAC